MTKRVRDPRTELNAARFEFGLLQKIPCSKEENKAYLSLCKSGQPLPEGVFRDTFETGEEDDIFYRVREAELTEAERAEFLTLKKLKLLKTIKNCILFFTILTITSILICAYFILSHL